jgi:hypothetical protein
MTGRLTTEVVPAHSTREPAATRNTNNINELHCLEERWGERLTNMQPMRVIGGAKFPKPPWGLAARLWNGTLRGTPDLPPTAEGRNVTTTRPIGFAARELPEADLDGIVAIPTDGSDLRNNTGPSFDHRDGNNDTIGIINLRHSDFSTEKSDRHRSNPHE